MSALFESRGLTRLGNAGARLFAGFTFTAQAGENIHIRAPQHAAEALFEVLCALSRPESGEVLMDGVSFLKTQSRIIDGLAAVPPRPGFSPELPAIDGVTLPLAARGVGQRAARTAAEEMARRCDLGNILYTRPGFLQPYKLCALSLLRAALTVPKVLICGDFAAELDGRDRVRLRLLSEELYGKECLKIYIGGEGLDPAAKQIDLI